MHRLSLIIKVSLVAVSTIHTCRTSYIVHGTGTSLLLSFYSPQSIIFLLFFFFFGWFDITRAMLKLSWNFIALSKYHCCVVRVFFLFLFVCHFTSFADEDDESHLDKCDEQQNQDSFVLWCSFSVFPFWFYVHWWICAKYGIFFSSFSNIISALIPAWLSPTIWIRIIVNGCAE